MILGSIKVIFGPAQPCTTFDMFDKYCALSFFLLKSLVFLYYGVLFVDFVNVLASFCICFAKIAKVF